MPQILNSKDIQYAGFSMRMLASVIDSLLSIIIIFPFFTLFQKIYGSSEIQLLLASGKINPADLTQQQIFDLLVRQIASLTYQNVITFALVIAFWIYYSATPGKILFKMQITDAKTGKKPSKKQFIIRYFGYFLAMIPLGLGFIWIHYDKKKQGWHDKLAGTVVIYNKRSSAK